MGLYGTKKEFLELKKRHVTRKKQFKGKSNFLSFAHFAELAKSDFFLLPLRTLG